MKSDRKKNRKELTLKIEGVASSVVFDDFAAPSFSETILPYFLRRRNLWIAKNAIFTNS